ncbi:LacI family DNA-binding transcriptional regulator [Zhihengliuella halotolerans]|uniref:LacI family DNA-binding transcriptional regulator n=1 Tax=Zhihengliuella halotolerans TaxID=370736 RepID=UPI000C80FAE5|nr:LacI family DNA-binding transcriptional regulator [Zhihengliuella halotolerans]
MTIRLQDIAEAAGVSTATASKALNGRGDVSEAVRRKITKIAEEMSYAPRPRSRPASSHSRVALVFDHFSSPYAVAILNGAIHAAKRAGVELMTTCIEGESAGHDVMSMAWLRDLVKDGITGLIVVTTSLDDATVRWCRRNDLPLIAVDPASPNREHVVSIGSTNWQGGKQATDHLIGLGHRRIGMACGPGDSVPAGERLQGFRSAMQLAGVPVDESLVSGEGFTPEAGRIAALRMLHADEPPTAIFAVSDDVALGVLRAAEELGIGVPQHLSVVGFDDTSAASWMSPPLTTVRQPLGSMGQVAVERVLALAGDPGRFAHPFQLETRLVVRESTALPA